MSESSGGLVLGSPFPNNKSTPSVTYVYLIQRHTLQSPYRPRVHFYENKFYVDYLSSSGEELDQVFLVPDRPLCL